MNLLLRHFTIFLLLVISGTVCAQYDLVNKTEKLLLKGKFDNALQNIKKSIQKDSANTTAYQSYAVYYTFSLNPQYQIDSAHYYNLTALDYYKISEEKALQKLQKHNINLDYLQRFKQYVDSLAFMEAYTAATIKRYNHYLNVYTTSDLIDSVVVLRNELAFADALKENTYHSYRSFMERYPKALQIEEAKARFEKLYFDESVKDGRLLSYVNFLKDHPQSVYRSLAEKQILELSTIDNTLENYLDFAEKFPASQYSKIALDYAYHSNKAIPKLKDDSPTYYDSLNNAHLISQQILFPFYNNGTGFINKEGTEVIPVTYQTTTITSQKCPVIYGDFIWLKNKKQLVTKSGVIFLSGVFDEVIDVGSGLIVISKDNQHGIIHKSGKSVLKVNYEDIKLVNGKYIAYQKNGLWGLSSVLGRNLVEPKYQSIIGLNSFILLQQREKWAITNSKIISKALENDLQLSFIYDEYELFDNDHLMVYQDNKVNLISSELAQEFTVSTMKIAVGNRSLISRDNQGYHLVAATTFQKLISSKYRILSNNTGTYYQNEYTWNVWNNGEPIMLACDSLTLLGDHFIKYYHGDSISFTSNAIQKIHKDAAFTYLHNSREAYILINGQEYSSLIDAQGYTHQLAIYDKVTLSGDSLLIVQSNQQKGLINTKNAIILDIKYDAIQRSDSSAFTLLQDSKFGIFNRVDSSLIEPDYDERMKPYGNSLYIARKENFFGLVDHENNTILPFEFDQIQYWNDASALVKKGYEWIIHNIQGDRPIIDKINQYSKLEVSEDFQVLKIFKENGYGIITNKDGILIPPSYYNIHQIQQQNNTLYVAEKYIEEADFYVVVYYNSDGEIIFKHAMESEYYQNINCDNP